MWPYRLLVLEEETTSLLAKHSKNIACGTLFLLYLQTKSFLCTLFTLKVQNVSENKRSVPGRGQGSEIESMKKLYKI